ncbi:O-methyltransferase [Domibacillus sp. DTU_2020_1001157_1_SI_ALB_TIR_016]|uniref:O-methyltransferase n=1 Tax=Domibacillus sp. DTU_2020_1001157_1_SI_ALB_TIR_016 TaxID=3077789 RepID=UPI0028F0A585|nr:O-methyltransferase [Domibacillus sp. DTU_2020_1001157_1_SI_ALB_TIR_016]WNS77771.1 O-methyltransferase [Domibacillus sp. DTU_2020_1001157_1_SI_ALB_TIR_016]
MKQINSYIDSVFCTEDALLKEVIASIKENGMPSISVSPSSGKLLTMLVSISGAKKVLEIGALGGYSGICLARGFGKEGMLTSLELEERYAELAHSNLAKAGFGDQVSYMTGAALESLEKLAGENKRFDFFFIDADKANYELYLEYCIQLAEPHALIIADNVLAKGSVAEPGVPPKRYTKAMKKFNELAAHHPQLESVLMPIGDGMTLSRVKK